MKSLAFTTLVVGLLAQRAVAQPGGAAPDDPVPPSAEAPGPPADGAASTPPPGDTATALPAEAGSDDLDLRALGLDPESLGFDDKLNIYGFADVAFQANHYNKVVVPGFVLNRKTFLTGNLNIYLAKNLTRRARALAEVRLTFLPNGSYNADGTVIDTTAADLTDYGRGSQWGGIKIERVHVEYDVAEYLTIRVGHWLTPYGIWNIDHGSPVIVGFHRPYIIGDALFPEYQTGLDLFGSHYRSGLKLSYHATISNGRGGSEAQSDLDNKFAYGGRIQLETLWGLKAGISVYHGRYTGAQTTATDPPLTYLEDAYAADVQYEHGGLLLQAEAIGNGRHYADGERPAEQGQFAADHRDYGYYALVGYRFDHLWNVMPFSYIEQYWSNYNPYFPLVVSIFAGLNFRIAPNLVLKVVVSPFIYVNSIEPIAGLINYEYAAQASWTF